MLILLYNPVKSVKSYIYNGLLHLCELALIIVSICDIVSLHTLYHSFRLEYFSLFRQSISLISQELIIGSIILLGCYIGQYYLYRLFRNQPVKQHWLMIWLIILLAGGHIRSTYGQYLSLQFFNHTPPGGDYNVVVQGSGRRGDVIMIFLESFSFDDSQLVGGSNNLLSGFDTIAQDGVYFSNMISNGCSSDAGHISALAGARPRQSSLSDGGYYHNYRSNYPGLATLFKRQGYQTSFISSAPLSFLNQHDFLIENGFQTLIDHDYFSGSKHYGGFKAAPDEDLYQAILDIIDSKSSQDQFVVAQTMSSHLPYSTPYGSSKEQARHYTDDQLWKFYQGLQARDYFTQGTLVLISDHRKFDPLNKYELQQRGQSAHGKIIGTIIGPGIMSGEFAAPIQQVDIYHTLSQTYYSGQLLSSSISNNPLTHLVNRDRSIRYCKFVDNQLHITTSSGQYYATDNRLTDDIAGFISYQLQSQGLIQPPHKTSSTIQLVGHRGGSISGQNTIQGIRSVAALGVYHIEIDVARTQDDVILLTNGHTRNISCPDSYSGNINNYNSQDLISDCHDLDGDKLHTIYEALTKIAGLFETIFLEIKVDEQDDLAHIHKTADTIADVIRSTQTQDTIHIISYNTQIIDYLHSHYPDINIAVDSYTSDDVFTIDQDSIRYFLTEKSAYRSDQVDYAHQQQQKFVVYTVSSHEELQQAIDRGVDMVLVSDIPQAQQRLQELP